MSNGSVFGAGALGGAVGAIGGAALTQPGGIRRVLGIVGLVLTVIVTGLLAGLMPTLIERTPALTMSLNVAVIALAGVLWLPWVAAKTSFPWMRFRWHWSVTAELVRGRYAYGMTLLVTMAVAAVAAVITIATGPSWLFAIAFILYALTGLLWGFLTASIVRRTAEAAADESLQ